MLVLTKIEAHYEKIRVLKEVSLQVNEKEIVTIIGANGAGKSTTLKIVSGVMSPSSGTVEYLGKSIAGRSGKELVRMGICRVPEGRHIFPRMTVSENLEMGSYLRKDREEIRRTREQVFEHFPILKERRGQFAGTLSGGEAQMLAIGRGLMSRPKLFLLDEPSLGLAPMMVLEIARIIIEIYKKGATILLVEQNARMALNLSHRAYVLETGKVALQGVGKYLIDNEHVRKAYLGGNRKRWKRNE